MATTENNYTGSTDTTYSFTFPYIKETDVKVSKNEVLLTKGSGTTEYTQAATSITLGAAPLTTDKIRIYRVTSDSNLTATFYPGSSIRSGDLNDNFTQNLYTTQENTDGTTLALNNSRVLIDGTYKSAITRATEAETKADAAVETADAADAIADAAKLATDTYVHDGTNLKGDGQGSNPKGVKYAVDEAEAAVAAAALADGIADNAKLATDRLVATTTDSGSTWTVAGNNTNASTDPKGVGWAITQGEAGKLSGDAAKLASDRLVATTSDGGSTWTLAGNNTNASTDPKGVGYAITTAEDAEDVADAAKLATDTYVHDGTSIKGDGIGSNPKGVAYAITTAESAQASVAASAIYKLNDDLSALTTNYPINADNHEKYVQINDSTGISLGGSGWTPSTFNTPSDVTFPSTFDGNSQLTLKARINNTSGKYDVVEYYANDPEARYGEDRKMIIENRHTLDEDYVIQSTMNALSIGPVSISSGKTIEIPENSKYVVLN